MIISDLPKSKWSKEKVECVCDKCSDQFVRRYDVICSSTFKKHFCKKCIFKKRKTSFLSKKELKLRGAKISKAKLAQKRKEKNSLTKNCKFCQEEFKVPLTLKKRKFCSIECSRKGQERKRENKNLSICVICDNEFKHYGSRITCSRECYAKYMSKTRMGSGNPSYKGEDKFLEVVCMNCEKKFSYSRVGLHKNKERYFCSLDCVNSFYSGENHPYWKGGKSKYPLIFNDKLKNLIKKRDNYCCSLCGILEKDNDRLLSIHHIDYDKNNCDKNNLITLCESCHCTTNFNRNFWEFLFKSILSSGVKIVKKGWGCEIHIVNNEMYCLKYLIFFPGKKFSNHWHKLKKETWHCIFGNLDCYIEDDKTIDKFVFRTGDIITLNPQIKHQLYANQYSVITEVSTQDFKEDSYRVEKGD